MSTPSDNTTCFKPCTVVLALICVSYVYGTLPDNLTIGSLIYSMSEQDELLHKGNTTISHQSIQQIINRYRYPLFISSNILSQQTPHLYPIEQSKDINSTIINPPYPSIFVIGSTKGGTTTLIRIMIKHLLSFHHPNNGQPDLHYWIK